jgi:hypothetical protein
MVATTRLVWCGACAVGMSASWLRTNTTADALRGRVHARTPATEKKKGCRADDGCSWHACSARRVAKLVFFLLRKRVAELQSANRLNSYPDVIVASMECGRRPPLSHLYLQKEEVIIVRRLDHRITLFRRRHYPFHVHTRMMHARAHKGRNGKYLVVPCLHRNSVYKYFTLAG